MAMSKTKGDRKSVQISERWLDSSLPAEHYCVVKYGGYGYFWDVGDFYCSLMMLNGSFHFNASNQNGLSVSGIGITTTGQLDLLLQSVGVDMSTWTVKQ